MIKITLFLIFISSLLPAKQLLNRVNPELLNEEWEARWITECTGKYQPAFQGVLLFRRTFELEDRPEECVIHVSADNRYKLYVNGQYIGNGPARSIPSHWKFETYDIADYLKKNGNCIAVKVWNYGNQKPWGQETSRTGLIVQGNSGAEKFVNTNANWKVKRAQAYQFQAASSEELPHPSGVGPCEIFDSRKHPWRWKNHGFKDSDWQSATAMSPGVPVEIGYKGTNWALEPRIIPQLEYKPIRLKEVERASIVIPPEWLKGKEDLVIPADSKVKILLDQGSLKVGYPNLTIDKGADSKIKLIYSEALYNRQNEKVHRDSTKNLQIKGYWDKFYGDGNDRVLQPLWYKTYRYLQLNIETKDEPLLIKDLKVFQSAYPFELKASFQCSDPELEKIYKTGWRTAKFCSFENYVDCPYYEQLQYFCDIHISAPVTYLLSGDTRLIKSAILQGKYSITNDQLTLCAAPADPGKVIPYFSLTWIDLIRQYLWYEGDKKFTRQFVPQIEAILDWYRARLNRDYMLGPMPYWNFVDCTPDWPWNPEQGSICEPTGTRDGYSAILSLQYVYGLQIAQDIFHQLGSEDKARKYAALATKIKKAAYNQCWDSKRRLLADTPERLTYSQHTNIFAALTGVIPQDRLHDFLYRIRDDESLTRASLQFQNYFHKCLLKAGLGNEYLSHLDKWKWLIEQSFTTFPEYPELNTRSDCHLWNSYPAYELLTIVCGIKNTKPGFNEVKIEPHLGSLTWLKGKIPWKDQFIEVDLKQNANMEVSGLVTIPQGLKANFIANGKNIQLGSGENRIK
jgi:hypothetical protein